MAPHCQMVHDRGRRVLACVALLAVAALPLPSCVERSEAQVAPPQLPRVSGDHTSISLWLYYAPAELLVTDPQGRRKGVDPIAGASYDEIPNAGYSQMGRRNAVSGQAGSKVARLLTIASPVDGRYELAVRHPDGGIYTFEVRAYDASGTRPSTALAKDYAIKPGEVHRFTVHYQRAVGSKVRLAGPR